MSRRPHRCLGCAGRTRHNDGVCATCRRRGIRSSGGRVTVLMLSAVGDRAAPTKAELGAGIDLTPLLAWHGTDCPCPTCARDCIPGRYA